MSSLRIPDDVLRQLGPTEAEALVEIACRLYETRRLPFDKAAMLAGITHENLASACAARRIPVYWVTETDLDGDLETLRRRGL